MKKRTTTDISFHLTLRDTYDDGDLLMSKGRTFTRTPKEWKKIIKTKLVTIDVSVGNQIKLGVNWFKVKKITHKITHIEQIIVEKLGTIA